jgi:hypothetical protein
MVGLISAARTASDSSAMAAARLGLAARTFAYLVIGWLSIQRPGGLVLLWVGGIGFIAFGRRSFAAARWANK